MELFEFMQLLNVAITKDVEDKLYQQWLVDYGARMNSETFICFNDYKEKIIKPKVKIEVDIKKIIEDAETIRKADQERRI